MKKNVNKKDLLNKKLARTGIKIFLVSIIMALMVLSVSADYQATTFSDITVSMINYEPDPVPPGNPFKIRFRVENMGGGLVESAEAKLVLKHPFSLYGDNEVKELGSITPSQIGSLGVRVEWNLLADSQAATGDHEVEFWYRPKGGNWIKAGDYTVTIRSRDAVLAINEITTDCEDHIVPGTITKVSFMLENMADNTLRDITLNLELYSTLTTSASVTVVEQPFTPIGSGNEKTMKELKSGEKKDITFSLFTDADAESKVYKVPYTLTYSDSSGTDFSREGLVGLIVQASPEISVNIESTQIFSSGKKGLVQIKLVNKGFSDVKFLDLLLGEGNGFEILSNPEVYIGKIESDDYELAEYNLMVTNNAESPVVLPLNLEYRDANGKLYTQKIDLELKLYSGDELKQRANGKGFPWIIVIILVALVLVIAYFIRRKRKKKA